MVAPASAVTMEFPKWWAPVARSGSRSGWRAVRSLTPRIPGRPDVAPPDVSPRDDGDDNDDEGTAEQDLPGCGVHVVGDQPGGCRGTTMCVWTATIIRCI